MTLLKISSEVSIYIMCRAANLSVGVAIMVPTLDWTKNKFDKFNVEFFGGKLKAPRFIITKTRSFLGQVHWKYIPGTIYKKWTCSGRLVTTATVSQSSVGLKMSAFYDRPEKELENILIHEMIHLMFVQQDKPWVGHGPEFKAECARIHRESRGTRVITVRDMIPTKTVAADVARKEFVVYILRDKKSGKLAYATSLTHQKARLEKTIKDGRWKGDFVIIKECVSDHDKLQGRTPTIATYGTKVSGRYATASFVDELWNSGKSKKTYAAA